MKSDVADAVYGLDVVIVFEEIETYFEKKYDYYAP